MTDHLRFNRDKISKLQEIFETNATELEAALQTQELDDDKKACEALVSYYKGCSGHLQQIILEYDDMNKGLMTASTKSELLKVIERSLNKLQIDLNSIQEDDDWTGIEPYAQRAEDAIYRKAQNTEKSLTILRQWHLINNIYKVGDNSLSKLADKIGHMLSKIAAYIFSDVRTLRMLKVCIANNTEDSDEKVVYNLRRALDNMANLAPVDVNNVANKFDKEKASLPGDGFGRRRVEDRTAGNEGTYIPPSLPMRAEQQLLKLLKV